ncbi:MAG: hypothetical protein A2Y62_16020 [Candidatus Fischerbacteria bacterium RBG_13_37_8]|uniref:YgjP-like metallopeptidase domain-containing protein n=1 Tax=Candidatus Fischerbacteria bacterium RBG_13_37_8 TaxID=1817863 RepID=A0A1F5VXR0_9BACT|nr:MAG: hypothetical protein A2Y62_16020 [Candidatus Fischerbacteria bacterium RBG_13_37_8]
MVLPDIPYKITHRAVHYPRLEFKTGELVLILPFGLSPDKLMEKHSKWIKEKFNFIAECIEDASEKRIPDRTIHEFKELVLRFMKKASKNLHKVPHKVHFRKMKTKWASMSSKKKLTINILMQYLPNNLIEYVIFHEIAHLIVKKHNEVFWKIVSQRFKNYKKLEKELFSFWFLITRMAKQN